MKITEVRAVRVQFPSRNDDRPAGRSKSWAHDAEVANPMSRYAAYKRIAASGSEVGRRLVQGDAGGRHLGPGTDRTRPAGRGGHRRPPRPAARRRRHPGRRKTGRHAVPPDEALRLDRTGLLRGQRGRPGALGCRAAKLLDQPVYALLGGPQKERHLLLRHRQRRGLVSGTRLPGLQAGLPLRPRRRPRRSAQERGVRRQDAASRSATTAS